MNLFGKWWEELTEAEREDISASVEFLEQYGLHLPFPHSFCALRLTPNAPYLLP